MAPCSQAEVVAFNATFGNDTKPDDLLGLKVSTEEVADPSVTRLHTYQIIRVVFLAVVTIIILISVCKMVFQLFVRYTVKQDDK